MSTGARRNAATSTATTTSISAPEPVEPDEAGVEGEHGEGGGQQHDGERGGEAPGQELLDLLGDELGDHHVTRAAEEHRGDVEAEAQREDEQAPVDHPGQAEGKEDVAEALEGGRAQARRRAQ